MPLTDAQINITEDDDAGWSGPRTTIPAPSSEPDDDEAADPDAAPPADGEVVESTSDSEPVAAEETTDEELGPDGKPKPETPEAKAAREKDEQIKSRWKIVEAAKKEHLAVAAKRKELEASTKELDRERQQFALERQTHAREVQEARSVLQLVAQVRQNPTIAGLKALGFDYMQLTTEMVNAGTPEAIARAAAEETRQLKEQLQRQQQQQTQLQADRHDAKTIVTMIEENEELFPDIVTYPVEQIAARAIQIRDAWRAQTGRFPTYQQVAERLQEEAKALEDGKKSRLAKRAGGTTSEGQGQGTSNRNGPQANGPAGKPSIGNSAVTTRASAPRKPTEEEIDEWALSQLRGLRKGA